jgi:hypothetical protein
MAAPTRNSAEYSDLSYRYVKIDSNEIRWVLVDRTKHSLRESATMTAHDL